MRDELFKKYETCSTAGEKAGEYSCDAIEASQPYKEFEALSDQLDLVLENPILSKDGSEIGGLQNGKLTIFDFKKNSQCEIEEQLPFRGSKVNFSYPVRGRKGKIAFVGDQPYSGQLQNNIYVYDRDLKKTYLVGTMNGFGSSYPGFTKDGRLIYLSMNPSGVNTIEIVNLENIDLEKCQVDLNPKSTTRAQ